MKKLSQSRVWVAALFVTLFGLMSTTASAFTTPTTGSFGYDMYSIVNSMITGPVGWIGAAMLFIWGVSNIMKQWLITVVCVVGATCIIKLPAILTTLGATIA